MSDTSTSQNIAPHFGIQRLYLKGQSLELPQGAAIFLDSTPSTLNLNLQVSNAAIGEGVFEVSIRGTLSATVAEKTQYLLEVEQAGIFEFRNIAPDDVDALLAANAPAILAPYLRSQLVDVLTRATLPPFYMPEINWTALALQRRQEQAGNGPSVH